MDERLQLNLLRAEADLHARLRDVGDPRKALIYGLRRAREVFDAPAAAIATLKPTQAVADVAFTIPEDGGWDAEMLTKYLKGEHPSVPWTIILAPVRRRGRNWAVLALRNPTRPFAKKDREMLFTLTETLTEILRVVDDRRLREVRRKIEEKIANRQDPKDLMYDILHGLRSLISYDHSASLFIAKEKNEPLILVAEQIAWTKARSERIGRRLEIDENMRSAIEGGSVRIYVRGKDSWEDHDGRPAELPRILEFDSKDDDVPREAALLGAPVTTPDGTLGVLKVSSRWERALGDYEVDLVEEFLPLASLAIQFSVRTESLQQRMLQSERKHALANVTRGVTHDVNNALGAMLPLVQQLKKDAAEGRLDGTSFAEDLGYVEESIQTCRRIFSGMLAVARGGGRIAGHGNLRRAINNALTVLEDSLKRRRIEVLRDIPEELPAIRGGQGDLTQLFLNLCTNARDAMPGGGELAIRVRRNDEDVEVAVKDNGCGIPEGSLARVSEPFFTTKNHGNGLGMSICRSIIRDVGGDMRIESREGTGTTVHLVLPVHEEPSGEG